MNGQFDDEVLRAIAKWPDVPACYGWLQLDRRGYWLIKGARITHARAIEFLNRHYTRDDQGAWFVQNGPQRAYCDLAYTPWIYRYDGQDLIVTHTNLTPARMHELYVDDAGDVLLNTEFGIGLLDDRDLGRFVQHLKIPEAPERDAAEWLDELEQHADTHPTVRLHEHELTAHTIAAAEVAAKFEFNPAPGNPQDRAQGTSE